MPGWADLAAPSSESALGCMQDGPDPHHCVLNISESWDTSPAACFKSPNALLTELAGHSWQPT